MPTTEPFGLPPDEAIRWFRQKGYRIAFDWRDTWRTQHSAAFTVAKAMQLDVLADIRAAVDDAIAGGKTLQEFTRELRPLLQQKGWWGEKELVDPQTGETKTVQLGSPRRLRTIYDTNLRQAHAAGRWERFERLAARRPYIRYVTVGDERVRAEHRVWHNVVRPMSDPLWDTIAPLNGWGDRCKLQQLGPRDIERLGLKVSAPVELTYRTWINKRTGEAMQVPAGVSPGFDYNPGKSRGFAPPESAPVLEPSRTFADYGRPRAVDVTGRPERIATWPEAHGPADRARTHARFRELFDIPAGRDYATVQDPQGVGIIFNRRYLDHLLDKEGGRTSFVPVAKATVEQPFETWMVPFRLRDGSVVMRLRYVGLHESRSGHVVVVERTREGNAVWTSYPRTNVDSLRQGYLLYPEG